MNSVNNDSDAGSHTDSTTDSCTDYERQTVITRVIARAGQLLQAYNAESRIIEQTTERLGIAFGLDRVEIALTSKAICSSVLDKRSVRRARGGSKA